MHELSVVAVQCQQRRSVLPDSSFPTFLRDSLLIRDSIIDAKNVEDLPKFLTAPVRSDVRPGRSSLSYRKVTFTNLCELTRPHRYFFCLPTKVIV